MGGSSDRRGGSGDWDPEEWPGAEWDQGETSSREDTAREREGGTGGPARPGGGAEIRADIRSVMDDPLYEPRPGDRALRESRTTTGRPPVRMHARPARSGLSFGQKFLLWIGFAFVSAISFAAGIIIGAGGGFDVPWISDLIPDTPGRPAAVEFDDAGPPLAPEGVIHFGDRGTVPSETGVEGAVIQAEKSPGQEGDKGAPASQGKAGETPAPDVARAPSPEAAPEAARKAPASPAAVAAAKTEPAPKAPESAPKAAAPDDSAAEMTFYETSTGKAAMPGLTGSRGEPEDEEAPPDSEPDAPPEAPAVGEATVPDVAQREAGPAPESAREPAPEPVEADAGPPSGAALLARRLAGTGARPVASGAVPASSTAAGGETYTVQVTTLADENEARRLAERLKSKGFDARVIPLSRSGLGTLYRIRVGRYPSEEAARRDLKRLSSEPGAHPYIRME